MIRILLRTLWFRVTLLRIIVCSIGVLGLGFGCSDETLETPKLDEVPLDNKLSIRGGFCGEGADDLEAFLKVMLIIDRSNSMNVTDPNNARISAAQELVFNFVEDPLTFELRAGVEFAVVSFFGNTVVHTRDKRGLAGFSDDGAQILFSLNEIARTGSNTGYDKALAQAFLLLDADMARLSDKAKSLSRYEVIFLSDGLPFPDNCPGEENSPDAAIAAVKRLSALSTLHKVPITFSTAFASHPRMFDPCEGPGGPGQLPICPDNGCSSTPNSIPLGPQVRNLLQQMAKEGQGTFTQFDNGDSITFAGFDFADARRIFALSNFVAANVNALPRPDRVAPDSDGDGLSDEDELLLGSSPYLADTDDDGFSDALEWRFRLSGFDALDPTDATCEPLTRVDTDGDGLLDCEEIFLGTLRRRIDTDNDGIPDNIEVKFGTNANSSTPLQDLQSDADADGGSDADELRWHTDPAVDDVAQRSRFAYIYSQRELPVTTGQACYEFEVSNITLASTQTLNAEDSPTGIKSSSGLQPRCCILPKHPTTIPASAFPIAACVDARYVEDRDLKIPAGGQLEISMVAR
ncbi:MAG: VWA domain-containing protein [Myxococcota bacterium]